MSHGVFVKAFVKINKYFQVKLCILSYNGVNTPLFIVKSTQPARW